jgi:hypothetical protein
MKHTYSTLLPRWVPRPLAALGLLLATAGATHAQTPTFAPAATYGTGIVPQGIALVDVNGDGRLDIINANSNSNNVGVLLGSATTPGTFPATATFYGSGGSFPVGIGVGDVNGDGRPDIVVANAGSNTVGVLLNLAAAPGTFGAATVYGSGSSGPRGLALSDVNGDGRLDVVTGGSGDLGVLLNLAASPGTFGATATYSTGAEADAIAVGDVNGDGRPDVAVSNFNGGNISLLLNSASAPGTFPAVASYNTGGTMVRGITLGDVNGDGRPDLVTGNQDSNNISVLLNQAASPGTFGAAALYSSGANGPNGVVVRDMNGDGRPDIISANYAGGTGSTVSVLLNSATTPGTFLGGTAYSSGGNGPVQVALGDLNGDGKPDIATTNVNSSTIGVLLNTTGFATAPTVTLLSPNTGPVGTSVTITGTNLTGASAVRFNGTAASSFVVNSATSITAVVAAGTTTGLVSVTTPSGTATSTTPFVVRVPPTTVADAYSTPAGVTLTGNVLSNDIGTNPVAILITRPTHGALLLNPNGTFTYQPAAGYTGPDSFTYYACDPALPLLCGNPATVSITVLRVAPVTVADAYSTPQNTTLTGNVLSNDLGTSPIAILIIRPTHGTLLLNPDGTFTYQPATGYVGPDSFIYYACDPNLPLLCGNPATVSITAVRVAPITVADSYATPQNVLLTGNVLTNDIGTNPQAILIIRPTHGALLLNPNGTFTYQPTAGYTGPDSFIYYACNMGTPLVCGDPATVSITVTPATSARSAATASKPAAAAAGAATELALTGSPNPFSEQLRVQFALPTAQAYTLAVYDGQGRLVQQLASGQAEAGQVQQVEVPTSTYATGLYLVRLTTATGTQLLKLLKY